VVPPASPIFYTVQPGDTLFELAQRYRLPLQLLANYNGIDDPARIHAGFVLQIPTAAVLKGPGMTGGGAPRYEEIYVVKPGDTLLAVAERVGLDPEILARRNLLQPPYELRAGQLLSLDGGLDLQRRAAAVPTSIPSPTPPPAAPGQRYEVQPGDTLGLIAALHRVPVELLREENGLSGNIIYVGQSLRIPPRNYRELPPLGALAWPVDNHSVIKGYFYGHKAIDMLLSIGSDVRAAAPGVVEIAGWHAYGYGNVIVIDHGHGIRTLYAHLNEFVVTAGQRVARGELIAYSGHTGRSTHPHLHFEVQKDRQALNPCIYLQDGCR
jgi:murein DD-endopeptidase MepM/ murein hydrolase activator NlpD